MGDNSNTKTVYILGRPFNLHGPSGDTYFETHLDALGTSEQDILGLLSAVVQDGDYILDIGANIGYISLAMAHLTPKGKVFSFEPAAEPYKLLKQNVKSNNFKNVTARHLGLSDEKATATLTYNLSNSSGAFVNSGVVNEVSEHGSEVINLEKLDDMYEKLKIKKCSLIKVDVEGHEPNFLRGAEKFIDKFKPDVIMEVNHWCLNVFNRMSLPDFMDIAYKQFPYLFAFHNGQYLDLSDDSARYQFYYENSVNNRFTNVFGGTDRNRLIAQLNTAMGGLEKMRVLSEIGKGLEEENSILRDKVAELENQLFAINNSRTQRTAKKINTALGR